MSKNLTEERKKIDSMTKSEMAFELDNLRMEYDRLALMQEIMVIVGRMVTTDELQRIKDYVEKVYKESIAGRWAFIYGVRDNIVDMVNNLADLCNSGELNYFNLLMYGMLLNREPEATKGLHTVTDGMKSILLDNLQENER
ncbi:MAG: hypothetical protein NC131_22130 [Roseburia sp.]|nr:hypothetical protein [Roseburia sp.]